MLRGVQRLVTCFDPHTPPERRHGTLHHHIWAIATLAGASRHIGTDILIAISGEDLKAAGSTSSEASYGQVIQTALRTSKYSPSKLVLPQPILGRSHVAAEAPASPPP